MSNKFKAILVAAAFGTSMPALAQDFDFDHRGITVEGDNVRLTIDGRLHLDAVTIDDELTPFEDDVRVRRGRLAASLRIGKRVTLKFDRELSSFNPGFRNVWIAYKPIDALTLRGGNQIPPVLGENIKSSNDIKLTERSLSSSLAPSFLLGGSARWVGKYFSISGGYFANPLSFDAVNPRDDGRSIVGRIAWSPIRKKRETLHVAAAVDRRRLEADTVSRERSIPEFGLNFTRLVDTGNLEGVDSFITYAGELGYARGPFLLKGQYLQRNLDAPDLDDPTFRGWSVTGAWVLTGERQRYSRTTGTFGGVRPRKKGFGAVELAARVGGLDLEDAEVTGGQQTNVAVGLNWYVSRNVRFMVNGVQAFARPNRSGDDETARAVTVRAQLAF